MSDPNFLNAYLDEIQKHVPERDGYNPKISKASVAWHLDHSLKAINKICDALKASDPNSYQSSYSLAQTVSLTFGYIPRGRAKAPRSVRPPKEISSQDIYDQLAEARDKTKEVVLLDENAHFSHPIFKTVNKSKALRFLQVHTKHHMKIVKDILKK